MAAARLQMILHSTTDLGLRDSLSTVLTGSTMHSEYGTPVFLSDRATHIGPFASPTAAGRAEREPGSGWGSDVADVVTPFAPPLPSVAREIFAEGDAAAQLLATAARQARALQLVIEANRLGAASFPDEVLRAVNDALAARPVPLQVATSPERSRSVARPTVRA